MDHEFVEVLVKFFTFNTEAHPALRAIQVKTG